MRLFVLLFMLLTLAFGARAQVDTVATYTELMLYNGPADSVQVSHSRYHGLFVLGTCTGSNYGTTFLGVAGCWQRVHANYHPRFWALGGGSPTNQVGPTVQTETDALNSAIYTAWQAGGDTIEIDSMYAIDRFLLIMENNTYLGTTDSSGFVRIDPPKTALTDSAHIGDSQLKVVSNAAFRNYQKINIASAPNYDSISWHPGYNVALLPAGGDSIVYLSGASIQKAMLPGDSVTLSFPMMKSVSTAPGHNVTMRNLVFDGNRSQYTISYDWRTNTAIQFPTSTGSIIENCRFYNMPSENIFLCGTEVRSCSGNGFNGSALHFSCTSNGTPTDILYNDFSNLNEVGDAIMAHSEAGFTYSAKVRNFRISYNTLNNVHEHGLGKFGNDDTSNVVTDNLLETAAQEVAFLGFYLYDSTNTIYNNKNPTYADSAATGCIVAQPQIAGVLPCGGGSSMSQPFGLGDTITITLDSLLVRNSNEGFVKRIVPVYASNYFELTGASVSTPALADFHSWEFETAGSAPGLVFDNGHQNGVYGNGNWGYEPCGLPGGCTSTSFTFTVQQLPMVTSAVPCPLQAVRVEYDSELGTWDAPILCNNQPVAVDSAALGQPILEGAPSCPAPNSIRADQLTLVSARLLWDTIAGVTSYRVWYKVFGTAGWVKVIKSNNQGRKQLSGLSPNTLYRWMVQARCGANWGPLSATETFMTTATPCPATAPTGLQSSPVRTHQMRLNWVPAPNVWRYKIRWRPAGAGAWSIIPKDGTKNKHWLNGLTAGTTYEWQMRTECKTGNAVSVSDWSALQQTTTANKQELPSAPLPAAAEWHLFPNPAKQAVRVVTTGMAVSRIQLTSVQGRVLYEHTILPGKQINKHSIPLTQIAAGVYLVVLDSELGRFTNRLIVR